MKLTIKNIIIAAVILAIVVFIVVISRSTAQPYGITYSKLGKLQVELEKYKLKNKDYPISIDILVAGDPSNKDLLIDQWGNQFKYQKESPDQYILYSIGPDAINSTKDDVGRKK
jgi:hypothetical protein